MIATCRLDISGAMVYPMRDYKTSYESGEMGAFGARRSGGRLHAGCDLYAPQGTRIYAVADGVVVRGPYYFYLGTYALEVDHGAFIVRYGEIQREVITGIAPGASVRAGRAIARVGQLRRHGKPLRFADGTPMAMLHIEMYAKIVGGRLTDPRNMPYKRRPDLVDPTEYLDAAWKTEAA